MQTWLVASFELTCVHSSVINFSIPERNELFLPLTLLDQFKSRDRIQKIVMHPSDPGHSAIHFLLDQFNRVRFIIDDDDDDADVLSAFHC